MSEIWVPDANFAIVAYDQNRAIGMDENMLWSPTTDLKADSRHLWATLKAVAQSKRGMILLAGVNTILPLLNILPPYIDDVLMYTRKTLEDLDLASTQARRIRTIHSPDELPAITDKIVCNFGGSKTYRDFIAAMQYVVATEIDVAFHPANKHFMPLHPEHWHVINEQPMPVGNSTKYAGAFRVYQKQ